jgi:hypothetical protein
MSGAFKSTSTAAEIALNRLSETPVRDDYLTTRESALYLKVSKSFLDKARVYGGGPPFVRLAPRKIVYRRADLDAWAAGRRFGSTSEYGTAVTAE